MWCGGLGNEGLDDNDDYCLELLVAGKIIHLSLPIRQVFEAVWLPSLRGSGAPGAGEPVIISGTRGEGDVVSPPMVITYRLPVRVQLFPLSVPSTRFSFSFFALSHTHTYKVSK